MRAKRAKKLWKLAAKVFAKHAKAGQIAGRCRGYYWPDGSPRREYQRMKKLWRIRKGLCQSKTILSRDERNRFKALTGVDLTEVKKEMG